MRIDEFLNAGFQLRHAAVSAATDLFHGQLRKPPFDEAQPRPVRRRVVHVKLCLANQLRIRAVLCVL